ncbi:MAG: hypothetical protein GXO43_03220 [Crenarchaeota archaeon]|nr:hypothetical protein [Thermoproteota archaeon]
MKQVNLKYYLSKIVADIEKFSTDSSGRLYVIPLIILPSGEIKPVSVDEDGYINVNVKNAELAVALTASEDSVLIYGSDGTDIHPVLTDTNGKLRINVDNTVSVDGVVDVDNFPSDYPLPDTQATMLKNKIRIMAWDSTNNKYVLIEGYDGGKQYTYDTSGNLTGITMTIVADDGTTYTVTRTLSYDTNGNLTSISRWELVTT